MGIILAVNNDCGQMRCYVIYSKIKYKVAITNINRAYYRNKGYSISNEHDFIHVFAADLPELSRTRILVKCDYCNSDFEIEFRKHSRRKDTIEKDHCEEKSCIVKYQEDRRYNHIRKRTKNFENYERELIEDYRDKKVTKKDLIEKYNSIFSLYEINQILKHNGIKTNEDYRNIYSYDKLYFKKINSADKAYFLGLIYAEACITKRNVFAIGLINKDRYILENLKYLLKFNGKIDHCNSGTSSIIRIVSKELVEDLKKLGVKENKTYDLDFPTHKQVPRKYLSHFIRGMMDGDGFNTIEIYKTKRGFSRRYRFGFSGYKNIIEGISNQLLKVKSYKNYDYVYPNKNKDKLCEWKFVISKSELYEEHMKYLYRNSNSFIFEDKIIEIRFRRKYETWEKFQKDKLKF